MRGVALLLLHHVCVRFGLPTYVIFFREDSLYYLCLMRSIQDPKKKKPAAKKPVVTSQDPDFPVSLLSAAVVAMGGMKPIGPSPIKTDYKQPEIIETPPTPRR